MKKNLNANDSLSSIKSLINNINNNKIIAEKFNWE